MDLWGSNEVNMTDDIDRLFARAATQKGRLGLGDLEASVWRRIEDRLVERRMGHVRLAALMVALGVGVANGGWVALSANTQPSELQAFSVSTGLSPVGALGLDG